MELVDIRDKSIPSNDLTAFKKYLDQFYKNAKYSPQVKVQNLLGACIYYNNTEMLELLVDFIKSNNIEFVKDKIFEEIYYSECRAKYIESEDKNVYPMITLADFKSVKGSIMKKYSSVYNLYFGNKI